MSCFLTVPCPWFEETTWELSLGLSARTAVGSGCGGGFYEGDGSGLVPVWRPITFIAYQHCACSCGYFLIWRPHLLSMRLSQGTKSEFVLDESELQIFLLEHVWMGQQCGVPALTFSVQTLSYFARFLVKLEAA